MSIGCDQQRSAGPRSRARHDRRQPQHPVRAVAVHAGPEVNIICRQLANIIPGQVAASPVKGSSSSSTGLGTVGLAVTGGQFFNHLSSPQGDLALANEGPSLDSCFGHSAGGGSYHYHANIACTEAGAATGANNPDSCVQIGYYSDGVPVYGLCKTTAGVAMTSCYSLNSGATTVSVNTAGGSFSGIGTTATDYSYDSVGAAGLGRNYVECQAGLSGGSCNLDEASGAVHPTTGQYSYFMTADYPWTPIVYFGSEGKQSLCSAA